MTEFPYSQPAPAQAFLCRAWGESDFPAAELVPDWAGVRAFMVREWTGSEEATADDGTNYLDELKEEFDAHEEDQRGGPYEIEFEIGGVSVERVTGFAFPGGGAQAIYTPYWQGGLSNEELARWWRLKTKAEPTDRDMSCFALGVEVGCGMNAAPKPEEVEARLGTAAQDPSPAAVGAQLAAFRAAQQAAGIPDEDLVPQELAQAVAYLISNVREWT